MGGCVSPLAGSVMLCFLLASGAPPASPFPLHCGAFPRRSFLAPQSRRHRAPLARSCAGLSRTGLGARAGLGWFGVVVLVFGGGLGGLGFDGGLAALVLQGGDAEAQDLG